MIQHKPGSIMLCLHHMLKNDFNLELVLGNKLVNLKATSIRHCILSFGRFRKLSDTDAAQGEY